MGRIADHVATMRGQSLAQIVQTIAEMEDGPRDLLGKTIGGIPVADHDAEFDHCFWPAYPHKTGKPVAKKAFIKARKTATLVDIIEGLGRYVNSKPADRPWLNPSTFLNQARYLDQPATVSTIKPSKTSELRNDLRQRIAERTGREGGDDLGPLRRLDERQADGGQSPRLLGRG